MIFLLPALFSMGMSNDTHQKVGECVHSLYKYSKPALQKNLIGETVMKDGKMVWQVSSLGTMGLVLWQSNEIIKRPYVAGTIGLFGCYGVYSGKYDIAKKAALLLGVSQVASYPLKCWTMNIIDSESRWGIEKEKPYRILFKELNAASDSRSNEVFDRFQTPKEDREGFLKRSFEYQKNIRMQKLINDVKKRGRGLFFENEYQFPDDLNDLRCEIFRDMQNFFQKHPSLKAIIGNPLDFCPENNFKAKNLLLVIHPDKIQQKLIQENLTEEQKRELQAITEKATNYITQARNSTEEPLNNQEETTSNNEEETAPSILQLMDTEME